MLNGPDIRKLIKDERFEKVLNKAEKQVWKSVKEVIAGFLGKNRTQDYRKSIDTMLRGFAKIGVHMSLKIHFLSSHLDCFESQLATESDEQGERFHQVALPFETR